MADDDIRMGLRTASTPCSLVPLLRWMGFLCQELTGNYNAENSPSQDIVSELRILYNDELKLREDLFIIDLYRCSFPLVEAVIKLHVIIRSP